MSEFEKPCGFMAAEEVVNEDLKNYRISEMAKARAEEIQKEIMERNELPKLRAENKDLRDELRRWRQNYSTMNDFQKAKWKLIQAEPMPTDKPILAISAWPDMAQGIPVVIQWNPEFSRGGAFTTVCPNGDQAVYPWPEVTHWDYLPEGPNL